MKSSRLVPIPRSVGFFICEFTIVTDDTLRMEGIDDAASCDSNCRHEKNARDSLREKAFG